VLKIKLTQTGKRDQKSYRIIVAERRSKRDGKFIATLGYYQPLNQPSTIKLDTAAYDSWVQKGALPTPTVRHLYQQITAPTTKTK